MQFISSFFISEVSSKIYAFVVDREFGRRRECRAVSAAPCAQGARPRSLAQPRQRLPMHPQPSAPNTGLRALNTEPSTLIFTPWTALFRSTPPTVPISSSPLLSSLPPLDRVINSYLCCCLANGTMKSTHIMSSLCSSHSPRPRSLAEPRQQLPTHSQPCALNTGH